MRASVAIIGSIAMLFVGFFALSTEQELVKDTALNSSANGSSAAANATGEVVGGMANFGGESFVWAGMAVFLLICAGLLITVYGRAR